MSRNAAPARFGSDRASLYDDITAKIIAELEVGRVPWVQPWGTASAKASLDLPRNAATGRRYSGINVLILWGAVIEGGFPAQSWLTFRQALSLGANVRKGERGTTVVYADRFVPDDEKQRAHDTGAEARAIPFLIPAHASQVSNPVRAATEPTVEPEEDEGIKPLPDRLMSELTTHRTLALRHVIGEQPEVAFLAALHALCLKVFYPYALDTCLELDLKIVSFSAQALGLSETMPAKAIGDRHQAWVSALPREATGLWNALSAMDDATRLRLFAHCIGSSVNAVQEPYNRRPRALAHADRLAEAVKLDIAAAGWRPTVDTYLGRVTKARILQAVRESKGQQAAQRIEHLKKGEMADQAQELLTGSGWVPEPLRTPGQPIPTTIDAPATEGTATDAEEAEPEPADDTWPAAAE